jgi:hypothetical protein
MALTTLPCATALACDILFFIFVFFSRNRVTAERSVAQTCIMAQTTRFDARTCLSEFRLCTHPLRGLEFPKKTQNFDPYGNFKPKRKC